MATPGKRVDVTGQPTPLNTNPDGDPIPGSSFLLTNRSGVSLDIGDVDVATGEGYELLDGETVGGTLDHAEVLYAVGPDAGPHRVDILMTGTV